MSWDKVSDFEINKAVAKLQGHKCYYGNDSFTNGLTGSAAVVKGKNVVGAIDYCNSWADMGPIISDNSIDLEWPEYELGGFGQASKYIQGGMDIQIEFRDKRKALRAAAIVYLMMNRVKAEDLL